MIGAVIKAFGYLRVSGKDQITGDGFPRQRDAITAWSKAHGYRIVEWFEEKAIPGKTEWDQRPTWSDMVSKLADVAVSTIFVERLDRLARDLMVQEHIILDLRRRHVDMISVAEPDLCIDDPSRKLLRQIVGAIAEYDRAMITAKLASGKRKKKALGKCEGPKFYGHHPKRPDESAALKFMHVLRATGHSFDYIASALNSSEYETRRGGKWIGATVCKILKRVS